MLVHEQSIIKAHKHSFIFYCNNDKALVLAQGADSLALSTDTQESLQSAGQQELAPEIGGQSACSKQLKNSGGLLCSGMLSRMCTKAFHIQLEAMHLE